MSENSNPADVAAANQVRRQRQAKLQLLLQRVLDAQSGYTGDTCTAVRLADDERELVDDLNLHLPDWCFYASKGGRLYMGTAAQVEEQKRADGVVAAPTEQVAPPPVETVASTPPVVAPVETVTTLPAQPVATQPTFASGRTFAVNDVEPNITALQVWPAQRVIQKLLGLQVEAHSAGGTKELGRPLGFHALMEAAHRAFDQHYGLVLSPDAIWVTVAQGFAKLVNREPEKFRGRFVTHKGKETIKVRRDEFVKGRPDNDWAGCYDEFAEQIAKYIGTESHGLLVSDFSTTGPLERAVSNVVLMDTVQSYFTYVVETRCGIPFITLRGTTADWQKVLDKVRGLATFGDLKLWLDDLVPIIQQFVAASAGSPDTAFWQSIYKSKSESGSLLVTGWLPKLLPLVKARYERDVVIVNPLLGRPTVPPHTVQLLGGRKPQYHERQRVDLKRDDALTTDQLPASLSTVPFIWDYLGTKHNYKFTAGIVGYTQNADDKSICPQMGWAVLPENAQPYRDNGY